MNASRKIFTVYLLVLLFILLANASSSQIVVTHFNAAWNNPNKVSYIGDLTNCDIVYVDIAAAPKLQKKHKISVVPTVIIYKDGKEIKRFQADISFSICIAKKDMQDVIDKLLTEN